MRRLTPQHLALVLVLGGVAATLVAIARLTSPDVALLVGGVAAIVVGAVVEV